MSEVKLSDIALTTPDRLRQYVDVGNISRDNLIRKINSVSRRVETFCGRPFGLFTYTANAPLLRKGNGLPDLFVIRPIREVTGVSINGVAFTTQEVDQTVQLPIVGDSLTVYRRPDWDRQGRLYCPYGWTRWCSSYRDLTGDRNTSTNLRLYNISIAYTGGFILPQWDGEEDATHNPDGLPTDIPEDLEEVVANQVMIKLSYPNRHLKSQRRPGGSEQTWKEKSDEKEWTDDAVQVLLTFMPSSARWRG